MWQTGEETGNRGTHAYDNTDNRIGTKGGMRCEGYEKGGKPRIRTNW